MPDSPAPVTEASPSPASQRSGSFWPKLLAAIVALGVAAAAVWFLGDVPNRLHASQAMREGRVALLASDLPKALGYFRTAALLRPADEAIVRQYDETQKRWVEMVTQQLSKLPPAEAYFARVKLPPAETNLVEPHLGTYRNFIEGIDGAARSLAERFVADAQQQWEGGDFDTAESSLKQAEPFRALLPDLPEKAKALRAARLESGLRMAHEALEQEKFAEARQTLADLAPLGADSEDYRELGPAIDEAEVRVQLREAAAALAKDDFKAATTGLDRAAEIKVLPDEVKTAREQLRVRAAGVCATELAVALARNDEKAVGAALAKGHEFAGWEPVPAASLLEPADLAGFLKALAAFGLGTDEQTKYANRLDLPLVLYRAAKFPKADVDLYARDTFRAWSRNVAGQKLIGLALFLDDEARRFGAPADDAWHAEIMGQVTEAAGVAIAVKPAEPDNDAPSGLNDATTILFKKALQGKLTSWPKVVDYDPAKAVTVIFSGRYAGYSEYDDDYSHRTTKTVRYQSGTRQVPNREAEELVAEHNDLIARYNQVDAALAEKQDYVARVNNDYNASEWDKSQIVYKQIEIASDQRLLADWKRQINDMRARSKGMMMTVDEPVYADEEYAVIDHVYTCSIAWALEANLHGQDVDVTRWDAHKEFRSQEIRGDASRGVPVKSPTPPWKVKLLPGLTQELGKKVSNVDDVIKKLPKLTFQSFATFFQAHEVSQLQQANGYLALLYAWESVGRETEFKDQIFQGVRDALNLPATENAKTENSKKKS